MKKIIAKQNEQSSLISTSNWLLDQFVKKQKRNSKYSLRAFARDLEVSPSYISQVLAGKKNISLQSALKFSELLGVTSEEARQFVQSYSEAAGMSVAKKIDFDILNFDQREIFETWYMIPVLDLMTLKKAKANYKWVSSRLHITPHEAQAALTKLCKLGFLVYENGKYSKNSKFIEFDVKSSRSQIRNFHVSMIERAILFLHTRHNEPYENRYISGVTIATNSKNLEFLISRLKKVQVDAIKTLNDGDSDEVYQFNIQLFPHTFSSKAENRDNNK